jgi:replicative DNA helicase
MNMAMNLIPLEIEQLVVGQVLYSPDTIGRAARILKAEHFGDPECAKVYTAALDLWRSDVAVDLVTVCVQLRKGGGMQTGVQVSQLAGYTNRVAQTTHLEHHIRILLDHYKRRTLLSASHSIAEGLSDNDDTSEVVAKMMEDVDRAMVETSGDDMSGAEVAYDLMNMPRPKPIYLGMGRLDDLVFLLPGNVVTMKGAAGSGKTAFMVSALLNLLPQVRTWIVSLEMNKEELMTRVLCQLAEVDISDALQDRLLHDDKARMAECANAHAEMLDRFRIDPGETMGLDEFKAKAEHMVKRNGCGLIVLDYAQLVDADHKRYPQQVQQLEAISKGVRATARKLNVPILVVVHISKDGTEHGTIQFEKDAHVRLSIEREQGSDMMQVNVLKNRNGVVGAAQLNCAFRFGMVGRTSPPSWAPGIDPIAGQRELPADIEF